MISHSLKARTSHLSFWTVFIDQKRERGSVTVPRKVIVKVSYAGHFFLIRWPMKNLPLSIVIWGTVDTLQCKLLKNLVMIKIDFTAMLKFVESRNFTAIFTFVTLISKFSFFRYVSLLLPMLFLSFWTPLSYLAYSLIEIECPIDLNLKHTHSKNFISKEWHLQLHLAERLRRWEKR